MKKDISINTTKDNIQCKPMNIVNAGNNLMNIFLILFIAYVIFPVIFIIILLLNPPSDLFIPSMIGYGVQVVAMIMILLQLRKSGHHLKNSYFTEYNGSTVPLYEAEFHKELLKKKGYTNSIIPVEDKCPACNHPIKINEDKCGDCGLVF